MKPLLTAFHLSEHFFLLVSSVVDPEPFSQVGSYFGSVSEVGSETEYDLGI
jgi:hypothetical protein